MNLFFKKGNLNDKKAMIWEDGNMSVRAKSELIDLLGMREKMDVIVFDYIDTSQHWQKALKGLSFLFNQVMSHFKSYVKNNDGQSPTANSYWLLFADVSAKLAYFTALATYELHNEQGGEINSEDLERLLFIAGYSLPAIENEENESLLEQIFELYKKLPIQGIEKKVIEFEETVQKNNGNLKAAIAFLHNNIIA